MTFKQSIVALMAMALMPTATRAIDINDAKNVQTIDLAGHWQFGDAVTDSVLLPGTTDTNHRGTPAAMTTETTHLTRAYSWKGVATYSLEVTIPKNWKDKYITLTLERTKPVTIVVDGQTVAKDSTLSVPVEADLSRWLTPGRHRLTLLVDNSHGVPEQLYGSSHALTEDTQTNWNGVIGRMALTARPKVHIETLDVQSDCKNGEIHNIGVHATISGKGATGKATLTIEPYNFEDKALIKQRLNVEHGQVGAALYVELDESSWWSEFSPRLYRVTLTLDNGDTASKVVGFRSFTARGSKFYINGRETFLRGKHDACVFPLTGHVAMDRASWQRYFSILKDYGINHVRFHSWCPPEACFAVADEMGFYLQPELPFWGDFKADDPVLMRYLHSEGERIIREYGHHPSFVMMALGNELWGSLEEMGRFISDFRSIDPTKLYTYGSNFYLGMKGPQPGMDYFTTCRTTWEPYGRYYTHTRASFSFADAMDGGIINHFRPSTQRTFDSACSTVNMPIISHETGQYQSYPDYNEISKYTGVLKPYNLMTFRQRLADAGMLRLAPAFHRASGRWAAELYKEEVEMDLRSQRLGGFQLLDLVDYPGQGSAYIGLLDAFMDSKGYLSPSAWRGFCAPVVPLAVLPSRCFSVDASIDDALKSTVNAKAPATTVATIQVANYGPTSLRGRRVYWQLITGPDDQHPTADTTVIDRGSLVIDTDTSGVITVGQVPLYINKVYGSSVHLQLLLRVEGLAEHNSYDLWAYRRTPADEALLTKVESGRAKGVVLTSRLDAKALKALERGARVLWTPVSVPPSFLLSSAADPDTVPAASVADTAMVARTATAVGLFMTDYWNYRMFRTICENNHKPVSPGTLGLLIDPQHPALAAFPTDSCTSWQWFPIAKLSCPAILDALNQTAIDGADSTYQPIVQVIDNIERNHRLGLLFEFRVGKGRLLVCMADLTAAARYPEGEAFRTSLLRYITSDAFQPTTTITVAGLRRLLSGNQQERKIGDLHNISY